MRGNETRHGNIIAHKVRAEGMEREGTKVFLDYDEGHLCSLLFLSILLFLVDWTLDLLPKYFVFLASFALGILSQFFIFLFRFKPQNSENFFAPFVLYISTKIRKMIFFCYE